jgi:hypothetical protein
MDHRDLVLVKNKVNEIHLEGALKCRKSFSTKDGNLSEKGKKGESIPSLYLLDRPTCIPVF